DAVLAGGHAHTGAQAAERLGVLALRGELQHAGRAGDEDRAAGRVDGDRIAAVGVDRDLLVLAAVDAEAPDLAGAVEHQRAALRVDGDRLHAGLHLRHAEPLRIIAVLAGEGPGVAVVLAHHP